MDELDKLLLDEVQKGIPVEKRPFKRIGERIGVSEEEVLNRLKKLKNEGIIRRIGGIFNSRKMGYVGILCAAKVPEEKIEDFVSYVNSIPHVTHNYERKDIYNIWFTITAESKEKIMEIVKDIEDKTGIKVSLFPAKKVYKLKVVLPMQEDA